MSLVRIFDSEGFRGALDFFAPARCLDCRTWLTGFAGGGSSQSGPSGLSTRLCPPCLAKLPLESAKPIMALVGDVPVHAGLIYAGCGESWLRRFKYPAKGLRGLDVEARALAETLAGVVASRLASPDMIVPVPMHPRSGVHRDFNPAQRFAAALAKRTLAKTIARGLRKSRSTRPQKGLGVRDRRINVRDAFAFDARRGAPLLRAEKVWLVDDVVTTGATLDACTRVLRERGVKVVAAICLARTPATAVVGDAGVVET